MNQKYRLPTQGPLAQRRSANPFRFNKIKVRMTIPNTLNRALGRLLKECSLLAGTGNHQVIFQCCSIVEYFLKTGNVTNMESLLDLVDLMEVLLTVCNNQELWLRVRAVYLTLLQNKRLKPQIKEQLVIHKALQSPIEQFRSSLSNEEIIGFTRAALESFYNSKPFQSELSKLSGSNYCYLIENNLVQLAHVNLKCQQWLASKLYTQKVLLSSQQPNSLQGYTEQQLDLDPYSPDIRPFLKLRDSKIYAKILMRKLLYNDSLEIWKELSECTLHISENVDKLITLYDTYFLEVYLNNNLHQSCNVRQILTQLLDLQVIFRELSSIQTPNLTQALNELQQILTAYATNWPL